MEWTGALGVALSSWILAQMGPPPPPPVASLAPPVVEEVIIIDDGSSQPAPGDAARPDDDVIIIDDDGSSQSAPGGAAFPDDDVIIIDDGDDEVVIVDDGEGAQAPKSSPFGLPTLEEMRTWLTGSFSSRLSVDANFDTSTREDVVEWWNLGRLRLDTKRGTLRAVAEAWVRWGVVAEDTKPLSDFYLFNARNGMWTADVQLREGYVAVEGWGFEVAVGQRIFVWGKNEVLAPADRLNPTDLRYDPIAALSSTKDGKVPIFAVDVAYTFGDLGRLQLVIAPFFTPNRAFIFGRDFALAAPGSRLEQQLRSLVTVHPSIQDGLQELPSGTELPDESPENATLALRATTSLGGWDFAATAQFGWDPLPEVFIDDDLMTLAEAAPRIAADPSLLINDAPLRDTALRVQQRALVGEEMFRSTYHRRWDFALEAEGVVGDVVLRADLGFSPAANYYDRSLALYRLPTFSGVVGAEYTYGETWYVQVSALTTLVFDAPARQSLLGIESRETDASQREVATLVGGVATARYHWEWAETHFQGTVLSTFLPGDLLIAGQVSFEYFEPHAIKLGGVFMDGPPGTAGGTFRRNDFFYLAYVGTW